MTGACDLSGLRVLVVEDEFLVAMDIELMLQELGCQVVGPIAELPGALRAAQDERLDLALLDSNIGGEPVTAVAEALARRKVPFVFCTGYDVENLPGDHPAVPTLMKPFQVSDVRSALQEALAAGGSSP